MMLQNETEMYNLGLGGNARFVHFLQFLVASCVSWVGERNVDQLLSLCAIAHQNNLRETEEVNYTSTSQFNNITIYHYPKQ
jgi:hypothetical protein